MPALGGCSGCGLAERRVEGIYCAARKKVLGGETEAGECFYFMPPVVEEGKPLSPQEHLLLKENEILRKK